jgi:hypothetical protein
MSIIGLLMDRNIKNLPALIEILQKILLDQLGIHDSDFFHDHFHSSIILFLSHTTPKSALGIPKSG